MKRLVSAGLSNVYAVKLNDEIVAHAWREQSHNSLDWLNSETYIEWSVLQHCNNIVLQPNSDLDVQHAWESAQSFMAVSGTRGPTYSESGSCHSVTVGEIEKFKMAAKMATANDKNYKIVITSLLIHTETYFLRLCIGFGTQATWWDTCYGVQCMPIQDGCQDGTKMDTNGDYYLA